MAYEHSFRVHSYEVNPRAQARLTTLANYFQEVAYRHATELGLGYEALQENGQVWVLSRMRIRMNRCPRWNDQVTVRTWPRGADRLFALRDFRVFDHKGKEMGCASTAWLVLNVDTHNLVRPTELSQDYRDLIEEDRVFAEDLDKIKLSGDPDAVREHRVVYSDLDIVGHVNNVKYLEWCLDALDETDRIPGVQSLEINFIQEALLGDRIRMEMWDSRSDAIGFRATRIEDGKEIFRARLGFQGA
ncbi:MAG: thioesterase [Bacteroidales bacterium]